jgi:hypothetical protein
MNHVIHELNREVCSLILKTKGASNENIPIDLLMRIRVLCS